jgi:alpha-D-xyloside xylohydrolase
MKQLFLLLCLCSISTIAQTFQKTKTGIKTAANGNSIEIQFYTPSIVRVIKVPKGKTYVKESLSVVLLPAKTAFTASGSGNIITLSSDK